MQFSSWTLISGLVALASAQNPFSFTTLSSVTAGTPFNITWSPSTGTTSTVTLILRQGDSQALSTVATIAAGIQNTGSYLWDPSTSLVAGTDYAFEIVDDGNTSIVNYSGKFTLISTNTVSASSSTKSTSASGSSTSTGASTTASGSTTASSSGSSGLKSTATSTGSGTASTATSSVAKTTSASKTTGSSSAATSTSASAPAAISTGAASGLRIGGGVLMGALGLMAVL